MSPAARPPSSRSTCRSRRSLEQSLDAGEWGPGEAIPSETELAARYGVSQGTVRKAIAALAADNLVVRRQGKGTFVATHTEEKASLFRFLRIRRNDEVDEYPGSRVLDVRRGKASAEAARLLDLKPGDAVILLRRVLEYSGEPVILDEITLPAALFKGLTKSRVDAYHGSMYGFFETQFGVRMIKAQEKLRAVPADAASARDPGRADRRSAARRRSGHADLRRAAGRVAARPVRDEAASLPQRDRLTGAPAALSRACASGTRFRRGTSPMAESARVAL